MAAIAEDECAHAQLSWDLHAWLMAQLPAADQASILDAARGAAAALERGARAEAEHAYALVAEGMPGPAAAAMLAHNYARACADAFAGRHVMLEYAA